MRVYTLLSLMPSVYQKENLEAMLGLFLEAQGYSLPQHSKGKSPSALLGVYRWFVLSLISYILTPKSLFLDSVRSYKST